MKSYSIPKSITLLAAVVAAVSLFHFYDKIDTNVIAHCQSGISTMRAELNKGGVDGLDEILLTCAKTPFFLELKSMFKKPSIEDLSCAYGMGIATDHYLPNREWDQAEYLLKHDDVMLRLVADCRRRATKIRERKLAAE